MKNTGRKNDQTETQLLKWITPQIIDMKFMVHTLNGAHAENTLTYS
jgi:hypothetical protein